MKDMSPEFWMGIAGIVGTLLGIAITSFFNLKSEKLKHSSKISEKIVDKRMEAHIALNDIVASFSTVRDHPNTGEVVVYYPRFFDSADDFYSMYERWKVINRELKMWSSSELSKEIGFIDLYLANLVGGCRDFSDRCCQDIGTLLVDDFVDFSESLRQLLKKFYHSDIYTISSGAFGDGEVYSEAQAREKLDETEFGTNRQKIKEIINNRRKS